MGYRRMNPWREGLMISILVALLNFAVSLSPTPWAKYTIIGVGPIIIGMLNAINCDN